MNRPVKGGIDEEYRENGEGAEEPNELAGQGQGRGTVVGNRMSMLRNGKSCLNEPVKGEAGEECREHGDAAEESSERQITGEPGGRVAATFQGLGRAQEARARLGKS